MVASLMMNSLGSRIVIEEAYHAVTGTIVRETVADGVMVVAAVAVGIIAGADDAAGLNVRLDGRHLPRASNHDRTGVRAVPIKPSTTEPDPRPASSTEPPLKPSLHHEHDDQRTTTPVSRRGWTPLGPIPSRRTSRVDEDLDLVRVAAGEVFERSVGLIEGSLAGDQAREVLGPLL